jgi:hypothetical protein
MDHTRNLSSEAFISGLKPQVINGEARTRQIDDFLANLAPTH